MQLRAVILAHCGGEAASRHCSRAAGGTSLGHLDDGNASLGALERSHGPGGAAADDQDVGFVTYDGNVESH